MRFKTIAIIGPTASGKTGLAIELSKYLNIEVISADSRQIYKFLDIGTAKPSKCELEAIPHHFIDIIDPATEYSAGIFAKEAQAKAIEIFNSGKLPVIVGGSGLYVKSLCEGFFMEEKPDIYSNVRMMLKDRLFQEGIVSLYDELLKIDSISAKKYNDKNPRRILRALEFFYVYGIPFSEVGTKHKVKPAFDTLYFEITHDRQELYKRINRRAEMMWQSGLIDETKKLLDLGYSPELNSLNTVGYKETIAYLRGDINNERALELIQQNTRRYAKRQMTWNRHLSDINRISGNLDFMINIILNSVKL